MNKKENLPDVSFSDCDGIRSLHLGGTPWIQGSMCMGSPLHIELEYVQRMMVWLLFVEGIEDASDHEAPQLLAQHHAMQLGLGAASCTKFCHQKLKMQTTSIEINPKVIAATRLWFRLGNDDEKLQVICADAGLEIQREKWHNSVDALQIDVYDQAAAGPVLDGLEFYRYCKNTLSHSGALTVNLFGRSANFERSINALVQVFGADCVWAFKPTREGNAIILANKTPQHPKRSLFLARAQAIEKHWGLPSSKWLRTFKVLSGV